MKLILTEDGSHTLHIDEMGESYHSRKGAKTESEYVFIKQGLHKTLETHNSLNILEIGFGTGLNALLTLKEIENKKVKTRYIGIEKYPVSSETYNELNYTKLKGLESFKTAFNAMHTGNWEVEQSITPNFSLLKLKTDFKHLQLNEKFNLIYFDAFGATAQPKMWEDEYIAQLSNLAAPSCVITTYSAKGSFRRALQKNGFTVERLPGALGKREMIRGIYTS